MFPLRGKTLTRFWPLPLGAWLLLLAAVWQLAPPWDEVTQGGDIPYLSDATPSRRGQRLFKEAFPDEYADSGIVLIVARDEEGAELGEQDKQFIAPSPTPALKQLAAEEGGPVAGSEAGATRGQRLSARIRDPEEPGIGARLLSRDRKAALVLVELTTPFLDQRNWATVEKAEALVAGLRQEIKVPASLDWKVPLFLFTILVAVGEDNNIFLLSRVDEDQRTHGPVQGVVCGLTRTGRIISTWGFIIAGSFAALFAGSFLAMKELGFALSIGVLLDTLVVRPILVPTFLILLREGRGKGATASGSRVAGHAQSVAR
jgi:uncharacterized membrane protein YdfJ with MMPL/SSD domain